MANKRDNSSQKRQRENRARRQALEARTKGAPARPSRVAPKTVEKLANRPAESAPAGKNAPPAATEKGAKGSGRPAKPRRERPPKPGDRPVDVTTLEGSWISRHMQVPGGTQVLAAGVMALVATGLMSFTNVFIAEADRNVDNARPTETVFEHFGAAAIPILLVPLGIALLAVLCTFRPQRRRIWFAAAIFLGIAASSVMQYYLFVAGFLAYGVYRAYKVEGPQESLLNVVRRRLGGGSAAPGAGSATSGEDVVDLEADPDATAVIDGEPEVDDEPEPELDAAPAAPSRSARAPKRRINQRPGSAPRAGRGDA